MKRITAIALFTIASFVTAGIALAQDRAVQATVPFDFTVGNKLLPSGTYTITSPSSHIVEVKNFDRHIALLVIVNPNDNHSGNGRLVFDKYGDQYFLHKILCQSAAINMDLPASKAEKRVRAQEAMLNSSNQVLVATR